MHSCLVCKNNIKPFISFGKMPIANGFLTQDQFSREYFFELKVGFCAECGMVQLLEQPKREMMFNETYAFYSSTSKFMALHFKRFAQTVMKGYLNETNPLVVEIGSNDGIMLRNFARENIRHIGIEPSANVAQAARELNIQTLCDFFDEDLAGKIIDSHGQADAILAANAMCHIPYLHSVAAGIKILLKKKGVFIFEDPYVGDILEKVSYDQIYDEHAFYFSLESVNNLFKQHDLEVFDVMPQEVHGGSMRYFLTHKGRRPVSPAVEKQREKEETLGLKREETYQNLKGKIEKSRDALNRLLRDMKDQGKNVVGYGATSKSTTVINYCGITPDLVEFISDTTPIKQGKYSPGMHLPVRAYDCFKKKYPDYALLFAWNHDKEIMAKENDFIKAGGKWIVYVPDVKIIS